MRERGYIEPARGVSAVDGTNKAKIERAAVWLFSEHGIDPKDFFIVISRIKTLWRAN